MYNSCIDRHISTSQNVPCLLYRRMRQPNSFCRAFSPEWYGVLHISSSAQLSSERYLLIARLSQSHETCHVSHRSCHKSHRPSLAQLYAYGKGHGHPWPCPVQLQSCGYRANMRFCFTMKNGSHTMHVVPHTVSVDHVGHVGVRTLHVIVSKYTYISMNMMTFSR